MDKNRQEAKGRRLKAALVGVAVFGATSAQATWHCDRWQNNDKEVYQNYDWGQQCTQIFDTDATELGTFCYQANGTLRVNDLHFLNRTLFRFNGSGVATLTPAAGRTFDPGSTNFTLKARGIVKKDDQLKNFKMSFTSNTFTVGTAGDCRRVSVEMRFSGHNEIACNQMSSDEPPVCIDPVMDISRDADEITVSACE